MNACPANVRSPRRTLVHAATVIDGCGIHASPGALLFDHAPASEPVLVASGSPETVGVVADATMLWLDRHTVLPALVNVHAHLDLTHIGPVAFGEIVPGHHADSVGSGFAQWGSFVMRRRAADDTSIADSVDRGIALSRAGGVAAVGDIAGAWSLVPAQRQRAAGVRGISFVEVFGRGPREVAAIQWMRGIAARERDVRSNATSSASIGLQPHAPYSCGSDVFAVAADCSEATGIRLCTHLAETLEEIEFAVHGSGPFADFLRSLDKFDPAIPPLGAHPLDALTPALSRGRWLVAHLNYVSQAQIERLATMPVEVAYCPRASAYFGHPRDGRPPHAYRAMLDAGVNVALGTDSILCLDTPDRISTFDEMRFLWRRDRTDPRTLLRMATVNGARALGLDEAPYTLRSGPVAGVIALEGATLEEALLGSTAPQWVAGDAASTPTSETERRLTLSDGVADS